MKIFSFPITENNTEVFEYLKEEYAMRIFSRQDASRYYLKAATFKVQRELMKYLNIKP